MKTDVSDEAVDRLQYAIMNEPERRIVFVTGAGVSLPAIPSTEEMLAYFEAELDGISPDLKKQLAREQSPVAYQMLAKQLRQRRGEAGLARAIRKAVLSAAPDFDGPPGTNPLDNDWLLAPAQIALAKLVIAIPEQQRGPIFTTNFDPQTEVALRLRGIAVTPMATPSNSAFPVEQIFDTLPVIHLHGFWVNSATLSTVAQLERQRPGIEEMLHGQFSNALIVVVGYGGWDDSFTRSVVRLVDDGRLAALNSELLWMNYSSEAVGLTGLGALLSGCPGVNQYWEIDAQQLFDDVRVRVHDLSRQSRPSYPGWSSVPAGPEVRTPTISELVDFTEGKQPNWEVASVLPLLDSTTQALRKLSEQVESDGDSCLVLLGPTGEGKSLALRQVALSFTDPFPNDTTLLYREVSAPPISSDWVAHLRKKSNTTVLFVDEADLIFDDVFRSMRAGGSSDGRIVWVLSAHSHYRERIHGRVPHNGISTAIVEFEAVSTRDTLRIASSWLTLKMLPDDYSDLDAVEIADIIRDAGKSKHGTSLFGAALHLWMGDNLFDRILDLLRRLSNSSIRGVTHADLLSAIAMVQMAWDPDEESNDGISLAALGKLCGLRSLDVAALVLAPLGREVGLARVGDRVYVRHPQIAEAIADALVTNREDVRLAEFLGRAAGEMRAEGSLDRSAYFNMYNLASKLTGESALAAARGVILGSPKLLESRVSYLAFQRRHGKSEDASRYARYLNADLGKFTDLRQSERGFFVEYANVEYKLGHTFLAVGLAAKSMSDLRGSFITLDQLHYGLVNTANFSRALFRSGDGNAGTLYNTCLDLLCLLPNSGKHLSAVDLHVPRSVSRVSLVQDFKVASQTYSTGISPIGGWSFQALLSAMVQHGGQTG